MTLNASLSKESSQQPFPILSGACFLTIAAMLLFIAVPVWAESQSRHVVPDKVRVVIIHDSPPTQFIDEKTGRAGGFAVDVMNAVAKRAGLEVSYIPAHDWLGMMQKVKDGEADLIASLAIDEKRRKEFLFTQPLESTPFSLFVRSNDYSTKGLNSGLLMGSIKGSTVFDQLKKIDGLRVQSYDDFSRGLFDLLSGKIDAFVVAAPTFLKLSREAGVEDKIKIVGPPILEIKRAIALRKDDAALAEKLNKAIDGFVGSPEYQRIYVKWYGSPKPYWTAEKTLLAMSVLVAIVIIGMAIWRYFSVMKINRELVNSINERKHAEEEVRQRRNFLQKLIDNLPVAVFVKSWQDMTVGQFVLWNKTSEYIFGLSFQDVIGKTVHELFPRDQADFYQLKDEETFRNGTIEDIPQEFADSRSMGQRVLHTIKVPIYDENHNPLYLLGISQDITENIRNEEDLSRYRQHLEELVNERTEELTRANRELEGAYAELQQAQSTILQQDKMASIGQLSAGVAHEINNPIGFIISNLSSLGKYVGRMTSYLDAVERIFANCEPECRQICDERQKQKIDLIRRDMPELIKESLDGAERVSKIVKDLKSFARLDSAEFVDSDLNEGIESTLLIVWNELKYKTTVIKDYGQLPMVCCNLGQLNQVFLNLIMNAVHAIESKGEIRIRSWSEGESVNVAISDTGCGISPEHRNRIFEPFFTTKDVGKGTGLGLAIAYDIVANKHGGSLTVESEVGKGSTFTVSIPVRGNQSLTLAKCSKEREIQGASKRVGEV